jgi:sugar lactone lactonase YvrE
MPRQPEIRQILAGRDIVGESIVWDVERNCLFWVDIIGRVIRRYDPETRAERRWDLQEFPTSIGLRSDGGAILGLTRRVALWNFSDEMETFAVPEPDRPGNRLNEGRVAPDGSFWVGTMQQNFLADGTPTELVGKSGRYYRIDPDGSVARLSDDLYGITNTMAWLPDGRFVTADTTDNALYVYDVDRSGKTLLDRRPFSEPFSRGFPDGSCVDAEGGIWTCRVAGGAALTRTTPNGRIDRVVELQCSWPTSCTFGGPALATLYVTSARFTMSAAHLSANPQEGGLFALEPGVVGTAEPRFRYAPRG